MITLKEIWFKKLCLSSIWIFRLFVNILTLVDKYSLSVKVSVQRNQFSAIISVTQNIFLTFFSIPEIYIKFSIFLKNTQVTQQMYFGNGRLQKAWLLKWLKIQVSEYLWTKNMLKGPNHHSYLHGSSFAIFFLSFWRKFSSKNSLLVASEILWLFCNILTPNDKYSLSVKMSA